jgi:hypothetical protein
MSKSARHTSPKYWTMRDSEPAQRNRELRDIDTLVQRAQLGLSSEMS